MDAIADGAINSNLSDAYNQIDFEDPNSLYSQADKADIEKMFIDDNNKLKLGRDNEKAATQKQKDSKKAKSGEPYTKLKQHIPDIDQRVVYSQLKVCYTTACGKGEYVIFDEAYVREVGGKIDIIGCDTKLTSNAPWTSNQNANLELRKGNASINKSTAPPKVLYPTDVKYEIRGKNDKEGVKDSANDKVQLSDFKGKPVIISKILKLECDGTAKGDVIDVKSY